MAGNSVKSLYPWVKQTSEKIFIFLFLRFSCLADKINRICMPVCPSESMWVFMFKLAAFPGVNAMLPLITMWWCALKPVSAYVAREELHTTLELYAELTHLHGLQKPHFQEEKEATYEGSSRSVPRAMFNPWFAQSPSEVPHPVSAEESVLLHYWLQILTSLKQGSMGEG